MTNPKNPTNTVTLNDMDLYFEDLGEGTPLVLLHGFFGTSADWHLIMPEVPDGYRLIIPDLRGHGRSNNPSSEWSLRQSALDILALLKHLKIDSYKAIGNSGGAKTLLHMALMEPQGPKALVLVSGAHYFPSEARAIMGSVSVDNRTEDDWKFMRGRHVQGDAQIQALWRQANAFKDNFEDLNLSPEILSTIKARTLIVHGDRDPFYPVQIPVDIYKAIASSSLWIIPNGGHVPILGETRELFVRTALNFLNGELKVTSANPR